MYLRLIFFGMKKRTCSESSPVFCAQKAFSKKNSLTVFRENLAIPPFAEEPFYPPSNVTAPLEFDEASWEDLSKERLRLIDCWDSVCWRGWESNFFSIDCSLYMQCCFFWEDSWKKNLFLGTKWFRNVMTSESNMKRSVNRQQMHVYFFQFLRTCPRKDWRGGRRFRDGALTPESRGAMLKIELRWLDFVTAITLMGFKRESIQICYLSWRSMSNWSSVNSNSVTIVQRSGGVGMIGTLHCCRRALPRLAHSFRRWWDCWDTMVRWLKGCDGIGVSMSWRCKSKKG